MSILKTYLINKLQQLAPLNKNMDCLSILKNNEWIAFNDNSNETEKIIFLKDEKLIISSNGISKYSKWRYIAFNRSLDIEDTHTNYLFRILNADKNIVVLNLDGTKQYCFLINAKSNQLNNVCFEMIQWYLIRNFNIDILAESQRVEYQEEQKRKIIEKDKERAQRVKELKTNLQIVGVILLLTVVIIVTILSIKSYYMGYI